MNKDEDLKLQKDALVDDVDEYESYEDDADDSGKEDQRTNDQKPALMIGKKQSLDETPVHKALTQHSQGPSCDDIKKAESQFDSQKTKKVFKKSDSASGIEEERRINSTMNQHAASTVEQI